MSFPRMWHALTGTFQHPQLDDDKNLKVTGISAANVGAINTAGQFVASTITTKFVAAPTAWGDAAPSWEANDAIDINNLLGQNGTRGFVACDGPGTLYVGISNNGTTPALAIQPIQVKPGEVLDLMQVGIAIDQMKFAADTDGTNYRLAVS